MPPENDGGEALEGYKIEWWPATLTDGYGNPEIQTLKIGGDVDGETPTADGVQSIEPLSHTQVACICALVRCFMWGFFWHASTQCTV